MDVLHPTVHSSRADSRVPQLEDYAALIAQLSRPKGHSNAPLNHSPTAKSAPYTNVTEAFFDKLLKQSSDSSEAQDYTSSLTQHRPSRPAHSSSALMDPSYAQHARSTGSMFSTNSHDDENADAFMNQANFLQNQQSDSTLGQPSYMSHGLPSQQRNQHDGNIFTADVDTAANYDLRGIGLGLNLQSYGDVQFHYDGLAFSGPNIPTTNISASEGLSGEASFMDAFASGIHPQAARQDGFALNRSGSGLLAQHVYETQPSGMRPSGQTTTMFQTEQLVQSPESQVGPIPNTNREPETSPDDAGLSYTQSSADASRSPDSIEPDEDQLTEIAMPQQDSRRPSMTADLSRNISDIHLQAPPSVEDLGSFQQHTFKRPAYSQSTLAERRRQQTPNGLNVQRPNMNRSVSSSAVNGMHSSQRIPQSPHGFNSIRRLKSSNVVLSGRVQKSGNASTRNSPMVANFGDSVAMQSSQATPQPTAAQCQQSLMPPSPAFPMPESHENMPPSASTPMYTPGMHSGSIMGQSYQGTPVTTPYGFHHQQQIGGQHWQPAPDMPQSAPAHMLTFQRDLSPTHGRPSMPPTPANLSFPHHIPYPSSGYPTMMQHHGMQVIVPSQHGLPEGMQFMHGHHPDFFRAPLHAYHPGNMTGEDIYNNMDAWQAQHPMYQPKPVEVKFDTGVEKLKEDLAGGQFKLFPCKPQDGKPIGAFQNLTPADMKKLHEKD